MFWLAEGDSNTKFFHAQASSRKRVNHIQYLLDETREKIDNIDAMSELIKGYYQDVFSNTNTTLTSQDGENENVVSMEQNAMLVADMSFEEFDLAVEQMHQDKAAGPDGLNAAFFQHLCGLLGKEVFSCCKNWLQDCSFPAELNDTNLVLIPMKEVVERLTDLRPIALCNVMYKILAKVLAYRLKQILPVIISENQSAFVPGRNITDNVLVAFELIHSMKQKKRGYEGGVALKLDISKAYDRVDWKYLQQRLYAMGFDGKYIKWMMLYVTTVQYAVCFNGRLWGPIHPQRGLRQGNPISPYLFLLSAEGLSKSLTEAVTANAISGWRIFPTAPAISHLLFANDSFLFFKASNEEAARVKALLNEYKFLNGHAMNFQKSGVFFSANVRRDKQMEIAEVLGVYNDLGEGKYLGLPSLIGRS